MKQNYSLLEILIMVAIIMIIMSTALGSLRLAERLPKIHITLPKGAPK